jgi:hypothetical protein
MSGAIPQLPHMPLYEKRNNFTFKFSFMELRQNFRFDVEGFNILGYGAV